MIRVWIGLSLLASLTLLATPVGLDAQSPPSVADPLDVQAILEVRKTTPAMGVPITVRVLNRGAAPTGPVGVRIRPPPLDPAPPVLAPPLLPPHPPLLRSLLPHPPPPDWLQLL